MRYLKEWAIKPSGTCDMQIEGYCEGSGELLTTANVERRIGHHRVLCIDGTIYELVGEFDMISGLRGRIPSRILDQFVHGVPPNWKEVVRGWSRPAEDTEAGIYHEAGNNVSRVLNFVQPSSSNNKRRVVGLKSPQLRPRTGRVRDETAGAISNSLAANTQLAIASGKDQAVDLHVPIREKSPAPVQDRVFVEKISLPRTSGVVRALGVTKPSCRAEGVASRSVAKTRTESPENNVCETRSRRAASLEVNNRMTTTRKKTKTVMGMSLRSASCPAHTNARIGTKIEACLEIMAAPAQSVNAGQSLLGREQGAQNTCKKEVQAVPTVRRNISPHRLGCVVITPTHQAKHAGQITRLWRPQSNDQVLKKHVKHKQEPKPKATRRASYKNCSCSDLEPEKAPKGCQPGTGLGMETRAYYRSSKIEHKGKFAPKLLHVLSDEHKLNQSSPLISSSCRKETGARFRSSMSCDNFVKNQQEPAKAMRTNSSATLAADFAGQKSGKIKLIERSLSGHLDGATSQKNVYSVYERQPVTRKRIASSSPDTLPRKRRSACILANAKTAGGAVKTRSSATSKKQMQQGRRPQDKGHANSKRKTTSAGLEERNEKGENWKEPGINPPDTAKGNGSNITEKAVPRQGVPVRVTRKSVQQSTEEEFKTIDKQTEKPNSEEAVPSPVLSGRVTRKSMQQSTQHEFKNDNKQSDKHQSEKAAPKQVVPARVVRKSVQQTTEGFKNNGKQTENPKFEKAVPSPVLPVRVTRKSVQQGTEEEFKTIDKQGEKPKSEKVVPNTVLPVRVTRRSVQQSTEQELKNDDKQSDNPKSEKATHRQVVPVRVTRKSVQQSTEEFKNNGKQTEKPKSEKAVPSPVLPGRVARKSVQPSTEHEFKNDDKQTDKPQSEKAVSRQVVPVRVTRTSVQQTTEEFKNNGKQTEKPKSEKAVPSPVLPVRVTRKIVQPRTENEFKNDDKQSDKPRSEKAVRRQVVPVRVTRKSVQQSTEEFKNNGKQTEKPKYEKAVPSPVLPGRVTRKNVQPSTEHEFKNDDKQSDKPRSEKAAPRQVVSVRVTRKSLQSTEEEFKTIEKQGEKLKSEKAVPIPVLPGRVTRKSVQQSTEHEFKNNDKQSDKPQSEKAVPRQVVPVRVARKSVQQSTEQFKNNGKQTEKPNSEKAVPSPVLPGRVTRKSVQQSTEQKFKNDDEQSKKHKSRNNERPPDKKSTCNSYVTESTAECKQLASHGVLILNECRIECRRLEFEEGLAAESNTLFVRRRLELDSPYEAAAREREANGQCSAQTSQNCTVAKRQKPAETRQRSTSAVIKSLPTIFGTEDSQQVSDQQNSGEPSLSGCTRKACASLEDIHCENQKVLKINRAATSSSGTRPRKKRASRNTAEVKTGDNASKKKGSATSRKRKKLEQPEVHVHSNADNKTSAGGAEALDLTLLKENKTGKSQEPSKLGPAHACKIGNRKAVEPQPESQPRKKRARTAKAQSQNQKPKPLQGSPQLTKALLAVTARKGTLKRKAQIRKLADALAAKDACDDFYKTHHQAVAIPHNLFDEDCWDKLSDIHISGMATPTPNSPLMIDPRSPMSTSSMCSTSTMPSPTAADAIILGIQKHSKEITLPFITPRPKFKNQSLNAVLRDLKELERKREKYLLKANCADSDEDAEESDSDSDNVFA